MANNVVRLLCPDMVWVILSLLDNSDDLNQACEVSPLWCAFVIKNGLCKQLCLRIFPQLVNVAGISELSGEEKKSLIVGASHSLEWKTLEREHRVYASLFKALTEIKVINWYPEVRETLIYELGSAFCVITEINIQPFQAQSVRFRMGQRKIPYKPWQLPQQHADEKFIWTYTSQYFPMSQENQLQNFKLSEPVLCIGGFLQIEPLGRVQNSRVVPHVQVLGRPLTPAFDVGNVEPSGKFYMKYRHGTLARTLKNDSPPTPSSVASPPEHRMRGRLGGLMQFIMQGNEQGGEFIEWEDDEDNEWDHML